MSEASGFMVAGLDVTGKKRQRHIRDNSNNTGWVRRLWAETYRHRQVHCKQTGGPQTGRPGDMSRRPGKDGCRKQDQKGFFDVLVHVKARVRVHVKCTAFRINFFICTTASSFSAGFHTSAAVSGLLAGKLLRHEKEEMNSISTASDWSR